MEGVWVPSYKNIITWIQETYCQSLVLILSYVTMLANHPFSIAKADTMLAQFLPPQTV